MCLLRELYGVFYVVDFDESLKCVLFCEDDFCEIFDWWLIVFRTSVDRFREPGEASGVELI